MAWSSSETDVEPEICCGSPQRNSLQTRLRETWRRGRKTGRKRYTRGKCRVWTLETLRSEYVSIWIFFFLSFPVPCEPFPMWGPPPHAHVHPVHSLVALKFNNSDHRHSDNQITQRGYSLTVASTFPVHIVPMSVEEPCIKIYFISIIIFA